MNTMQLLTLLCLPRIGRNTVQHILQTAGYQPSGDSDLNHLLLESKRYNSRIPAFTSDDFEKARDKAMKILEDSERLGIRVLGILDPYFPKRLRMIPDPPVVLYVKGALECLSHDRAVAVIGTREPSPYGEKMGVRLGRIFAEMGFVVVSGLAKGCDTNAHKGCLQVEGRTVAILAHGLDTVYPAENRPLADHILTTGGCLVSEYAPGVRGRPNFFVERDRLQSGLSNGVAVIETDIKGGTMHTVEFCLKQHKPLGCLTHPEKFFNDKARGNRKLIAEGKALPIGSPEEIDLFAQKISTLPEVGTNDLKPAKRNTENQISLFDERMEFDL